MRILRPSTLALVGLLAATEVAHADDTWTTIAPGIEHLHRTTPAPQDYHVVLVDLTRPEIYLQATGPGENGQRTSSFAQSVGATVAINGDLWDANNWNAYEPLGLAVGEGWKWRDDTDTWSFLACDPSKQCSYDSWGHLAPTAPRWWTAIGGMQDLLVIDGVAQSYTPQYYQEREPRTATGLTQDGSTLILLVVDGRTPIALGMSFAELSAVMLEFDAWTAANHDGGGSSTLVVGGAVANIPSDGSERVVANHLAVVVSDHTDPACVGVENAKQCVDDTQYRTCIGGIDHGLSDCGVYGLTCETDGLFAFCVDPQCTSGGMNSFCLGETAIAMCTDGVYSEGDCAGFGLPCVEGFGTAWCWADFYQGTPVDSSLGAPEGGELSLPVDQTTGVWFDIENTGLMPWLPGTTLLAPIPRDEDSLLAAPDWLSAHRAATVETEVAPGEVGRFRFSVYAYAEGEHELSLGLVHEGVTWFADPPSGGGPEDGALTVMVQAVDPSSSSSSGQGGSGAAAAGVTGSESGDCGCAVPGQRGRALGTLALLGGLVLLRWRRRRARTR